MIRYALSAIDLFVVIEWIIYSQFLQDQGNVLLCSLAYFLLSVGRVCRCGLPTKIQLNRITFF